jgi:microcystin-dependent protein
MANYAQTSKNFTGQFMTGLAGVNTGLIIPWGSASVPSGFLECNGQSVSTSTYADLFAVIAYTYGGSGASFNVPDLTDRTVVNKSNTKNLAQTGGANTVTSQGNISGNLANYTLTTAEIAAHTHGNFSKDMFFSGCYPAVGGAPGSFYGGPSSNTGGGGAHTHSLSSPAFSGDSTSVLQPYIVLIYIIKT